MREMLDEGALEDKGKNWEPLATLQKRRVILDQLRKQAAEGTADLNAGVDEIDARVRLYRGLQPSRIRVSHSRGYEEAREWLNTVAARLVLATADVRRTNRKKALTVNHNNRAAKTFYGFSAPLDADDRLVVGRHIFHLLRVEKMRNMLDREKCVPDDVMSIEPDLDQHLLALEQGEDPGEDAIHMWECVGLTESDIEPDQESHAGPQAGTCMVPLGEHACEIPQDSTKSSPTLRKKKARAAKEKAASGPVAVEVA
eukprot:TRINITY_DN23118_c0_g1_i4.p1 TRINITY_DN23118_c0_g1~~TRINITY_DN23118_c0_g1_i4.p1  ORF type:complete len:256 (+),score=56.68 TRINITY_DN23118_c0_g1_i4:216-983(+)